MFSWIEYLQLRELGAIEPTSTTNTPTDSSPSSNEDVSKIADMAWTRYQSETKEFFSRLAEKDHDIKDLLSKIDGGPDPISKSKPEKFGDDDTIMPPPSDSSPDIDEM